MWVDQLSQVSSNHRDHSSSENCNDEQNVRWFGKPISSCSVLSRCVYLYHYHVTRHGANNHFLRVYKFLGASQNTVVYIIVFFQFCMFNWGKNYTLDCESLLIKTRYMHIYRENSNFFVFLSLYLMENCHLYLSIHLFAILLGWLPSSFWATWENFLR